MVLKVQVISLLVMFKVLKVTTAGLCASILKVFLAMSSDGKILNLFSKNTPKPLKEKNCSQFS